LLDNNILKYFKNTDSVSFHPTWEGDKSFLGQNNGKGIVKLHNGIFKIQNKKPDPIGNQGDYFYIEKNVLKFYKQDANANFIVSPGSKVIV